jgi:CRP/FNR family cyclic AMP-dependent transcriptional regulator
MNARAICVTAAQLFVLDAEKLRTAFDEEPRIGYEVMRQVAAALARRLVATRMQLLDVYGAEPPQIPEPTDVD